jgi:hypothetical protein
LRHRDIRRQQEGRGRHSKRENGRIKQREIFKKGTEKPARLNGRELERRNGEGGTYKHRQKEEKKRDTEKVKERHKV